MTFDLYLDGTLLNGLDKTASSGSVTLSNPGTVVLAKADGSDPNGDDAWMKLDEVVFWEKLLTSDEIMKLYNGYLNT